MGHTLGSDDQPSRLVPLSNSGSPPARPSGSSTPSQGEQERIAGLGGGFNAAALNPSGFDSLLSAMMGARGGNPQMPGAFGSRPPFRDEDEDDEDSDDEDGSTARVLHFWRNGFSIEDGPLLSYDDPQNKALLEAVQAGRAPPGPFGVRYNQPVDVRVNKRLDEDYRPPPKKPMRPFGGSGNRLGNVVPEVSSRASTPGPAASSTSAVPAASSSGPAAPSSSFEVDESKPNTSIQVRLGDGTRIVAKVNLTHTVGDLRAFVSAARPDSRPFVLQTTFPTKELKDDSETIEAAKLQNAVVVQRFV